VGHLSQRTGWSFEHSIPFTDGVDTPQVGEHSIPFTDGVDTPQVGNRCLALSVSKIRFHSTRFRQAARSQGKPVGADRLQQSALSGERNGLRSIFCPQLVKDGIDVELDRAFCDRQVARDLLGR
jgi:hypothetical protein